MEKARHISVIEVLGLTTHPYIARCQSKNRLILEGRRWYEHVVRVLYRHDLDSEFWDHTAAKRMHGEQRGAERAYDERLLRKGQRHGYEAILARSWAAHVRQVVRDGHILELPGDLAGTMVQGLSARLAAATEFRMGVAVPDMELVSDGQA